MSRQLRKIGPLQVRSADASARISQATIFRVTIARIVECCSLLYIYIYIYIYIPFACKEFTCNGF